MGAFSEIFFLPVSIVSCNTLLYKNSSNRSYCLTNFSSRKAPTEKMEYTTTQPIEFATRWKQKQYLETHSKGCKQSHKMGVFAIFCKKSLKRPYCEAIYAPRMCFRIFFLFLSRSIFHWLHFAILYFFSRCCS